MPTIALIKVDLDGSHIVVKELRTKEVYLDNDLPEEWVISICVGSEGIMYAEVNTIYVD